MKIIDNGVIRDMTPDEEREFIEMHEHLSNPEEAESNKAEAYDILMGVSE